ncbi:hypothetical protein HZB60_06760 [candidate division KSB1 bacterium]|nr:hypothetical protein [candidate division KSB1 bacterium]
MGSWFSRNVQFWGRGVVVLLLALLLSSLASGQPIPEDSTKRHVRGGRTHEVLVAIDDTFVYDTLPDPGVLNGILFPRVDERILQLVSRRETLGSMPMISSSRPWLQIRRRWRSPSLARGSTWSPSRAGREARRFDRESRSTENLSVPIDTVLTSQMSRWCGATIHRTASLSWVYRDGFHLYRTSVGGKLGFAINPVYGYELISTDDDRGQISRFTGGLRVEGGYAGKLRYMMDFRDHTESGNGPYDTRSQLYEDEWGSVDLKHNASTSYNTSESFVQWYGKDLSLAAGRGRFQWGPGQFGSLFLNSKNPPFDYLRFDGAFESEGPRSSAAVYYTFLHGFLQSSLPGDTLYYASDGRARYLNREKYLSAQRLEIRPRGNLIVAFSQSVIYGDRGVQLGYLTPLNFLYSVQHSNDDKDNFLMSFDGTWRPVAGLKLYGEALFDDIIVGELMNSAVTNKSAYTIGTQTIVPREVWNHFDLKLEYTHIRPFVYSHFFATNTYTHWYSPLGYTLEPNSEFMTAELTGSFYPFYLTLHASRQNHGANTETENVGGDIYLPSAGDAKADAPFLAGRFERTTRLGVRASFEALENLWLYGEGATFTKSRAADRFETRIGFGWNL